MSVVARPTPRARPRTAGEARARQIRWWHYLLAGTGLVTVGGMVYGFYAAWFAVTHVRTSYARVSGYVVALSAKDDTRVKRLLVRTGEKVRQGQTVAILDNADVAAQAEQAKATLLARESALNRAEAELDMTIRQSAASIEEAEAQLAASQARLSQAEAEKEMASRTERDEVKRAQAELAVAKARLRQVEAGPRPQEIEQEKADLASAESQSASAAATLRRMEKLQKEGAVSEQALDAARTDLEVAQAAVNLRRQKLSLLQAGSRPEDIEAARQAVTSAEAAVALATAKSFDSEMKVQQVATRVAEKRQAAAGVRGAQSLQRTVALKEQDVLAQRAAVAEAKAALEAARARVSDTELRSTDNGVVVAGQGQSIHEGESVTNGQPIVTIVSTARPFWISASVSELQVSQVKEGQPALIWIDAFRRQVFHGTVSQVGGATEFSAADTPWALKQVPLRLSFDPGKVKDSLKPGMSCRVWIDVRR